MRSSPLRPGTLLIALLGAALGGACAGEPAADGRPPASGGIVDSALPIETLLGRFRATIPDTPTTITGGASTPETLARTLLSAVADNDSATIRALVMNRGEFAWLYYPFTRYTRPPYELGPELVWIQHVAASEKGISRLLTRYGGSRLRFETLTCDDSAGIEGPNRIVGNCRVRFTASDSSARELRLFGALLNRDGRYKFLSYANDL